VRACRSDDDNDRRPDTRVLALRIALVSA